MNEYAPRRFTIDGWQDPETGRDVWVVKEVDGQTFPETTYDTEQEAREAAERLDRWFRAHR